MLDSIRTLADEPLDATVLLAADRQAHTRRQRLLMQARQHASRLVAEASEQAEKIRTHALAQGYSHGVLQAADVIAQALLLKQGMAARLQTEVTDTVKTLLEGALGHPEWAQTLLQGWLLNTAPDASGTLQVVVPERVATKELRLRLAPHWPGTLIIESHDRPALLFRHGDQLLEFNIPVVIERLAPQVLMQLSGLKPALRQLEASCADYLQTWVDGVVGHARAQTQDSDHGH